MSKRFDSDEEASRESFMSRLAAVPRALGLAALIMIIAAICGIAWIVNRIWPGTFEFD